MKGSRLDRKDMRILNILLEDSSSSYRKISKQAGFSLGTVMSRIRKLKESGIIIKSTIQIDYQKIGYDLGVLIDVQVGKGRLFEFEKAVSRHPNVFGVFDITGDFDVSILARFQSRQDLDLFVKSLQRMENVERTNTKLILNWIKDEPPKFQVGLK